MLIRVTKRHIEEGLRCMLDACPVALALKNEFATSRVGVITSVARVVLDNKTLVLKLPTRATHFIHRFDSGLPVKPFSFRIRRPQ